MFVETWKREMGEAPLVILKESGTYLNPYLIPFWPQEGKAEMPKV